MDRPKQDAHLVLNTLGAAGKFARGRMTLLPVPMHWSAGVGALGRLGIVGKTLSFLGAHLRIVAGVRRHADADLIVIREFITTLVAIVWPLLWPFRRRLCFLINHNLQEAHERSLERTLLRMLYRSGMRFACFESTAGWEAIGILPEPDRILVLPFPVVELAPPRPAADANRLPVIGLIGAIRAEKGADEMLARLIEMKRNGTIEARIVIGAPMRDWPARAEADIEFIDTTDRQGYLDAIDRCDIVVLNYQRERYYFRSSGVAADAISRRAVVVAPDFPIIRDQLTLPEPVGTCFRNLNDFERAVREAIDLTRTPCPDRWEAHAAARTTAALAERYDRFIAGAPPPRFVAAEIPIDRAGAFAP